MTGYTFSQLFDFTRTTAGTFVGSNGLIQNTPASVNLLTFTQEFDNAAWVKAQTTVTANAAAAPDGTLTADKMLETAVTNVHAVYANFTYIAGTIYAASVYAKAAERSWIYLGADTSAAEAVFFDLATGTVGSQGTGYVGSIQSVGDGWYRCTVIVTQATALPPNYFVVGVASANNTPSYAGVATSGVLIWGAQLEVGSAVTDYTRNNGGLFPARFDYDPVTLAPRGILIEEQRTNLLTYSAQFDDAAWTKTAASVPATNGLAPDGTLTADTLREDGTNNTHVVNQNPTAAASTAYTTSVYFKRAAGTRNAYIQINNNFSGTGGACFAWFDLQAGTASAVTDLVPGFTSTSAAITAIGNDWYRCVLRLTTVVGTTSLGIFCGIYNGSRAYTGDGTSGIFLWGAQLEAGAFATSYIPTVASQVTRSADLCTITAPMFAPWYNQTESTFVVEASSINNDTGVRRMPLALSDAALTFQQNKISPMYDVGSFNVFALWVFGTASIVAVRPSPNVVEPAVGVTSKLAFTIKSSDTAAAINGNTPGTATTAYPASLPMQLLRMGSENILDGQGNFSGHIRRVTYYPFRASNNQLQALTT
jgi:hypothetical protein